MTNHPPKGHLSAERLQALLDGDLPSRELVSVEEHLSGCSRCSAELDTWRVLFTDLADVRSLRPHEGFADRVMARVEVPLPEAVRAGVWARLLASVGKKTAAAHIELDRIQDYLDGSLSSRAATRVQTHVDSCEACATTVGQWRSVFGALEGLERFEPSEGFGEAVMAGVMMPVPARAASLSPLAHRTLAWARKLAPHTRRAWAALSGMAVTPAVTAGLVVYAVFSHPTLTFGSLASFVGWQLSDVATAAWSTLAGGVTEGIQGAGLTSVLGAAAGAPLLLVGAALLYSLFGALAVRVLYRNLVTIPSVDGGYA